MMRLGGGVGEGGYGVGRGQAKVAQADLFFRERTGRRGFLGVGLWGRGGIAGGWQRRAARLLAMQRQRASPAPEPNSGLGGLWLLVFS